MYNINIVLLLDNKSLIARIRKLRQQPNQYPSKCMVPEYNIISAIVNIMQPLSNITIQYTKSKTNEYHHFCHLLADEAKTMEIPNTTIVKTTHQMPKLIINNHKVSSEYTDEIRKAIAQPALNEYLKTKYLWNDATIDMVDWRSHGKALATIHGRRQKTITQFVYRWLPLNASHSLQAEGTGKLCPFCQQDDETHRHYLICNHPEANNNWVEIAQQLQSKLHKYNKNLDNMLIRLLTMAVTDWRDTPRPPRPAFLPMQYHELFHQQSIIGWNHIMAGHLTTLWSTIQEQIYPTIPPTWTCYFIRTLWQLIYDNWKLRCDKNHGTTSHERQRRALLKLTPKIQSLYDKQHLIDPSDQYLFATPIRDLLELPTHTIENWLYKAEIRVKDSIKRQKNLTQQNMQPIRNFFQRLIPPVII
jgi:hypothetical protein